MKLWITTSLLGLALSSSAFAETKSLHDQFSGQGYGTAGCGLGSIVFGPKPGMVQVFAATTNGTFGSQTFGISSGTSNCVDSKTTASLYIQNNKLALSNDVARGHGEVLNGLAMTYGCTDSVALGSVLQSNYRSIFTSTDAKSSEIENSIRGLIESSPQVSQSCQLG